MHISVYIDGPLLPKPVPSSPSPLSFIPLSPFFPPKYVGPVEHFHIWPAKLYNNLGSVGAATYKDPRLGPDLIIIILGRAKRPSHSLPLPRHDRSVLTGTGRYNNNTLPPPPSSLCSFCRNLGASVLLFFVNNSNSKVRPSVWLCVCVCVCGLDRLRPRVTGSSRSSSGRDEGKLLLCWIRLFFPSRDSRGGGERESEGCAEGQVIALLKNML